MITLDDLCSVVASIGLPWANTNFERGEDMDAPYIVLSRQDVTTIAADDQTWFRMVDYDIELYTTRRDYKLESTVTDSLDNAGIYFADGGVWPIPAEGLIETVFTITVRE